VTARDNVVIMWSKIADLWTYSSSGANATIVIKHDAN